MTANELIDKLQIAQGNNNVDELTPEVIDMLQQQAKEIEELKADAKRYRYLRSHCYKLKYPNSEIDRAMELNFVVSGVWSDNKNPEVLDGLIDEKIGEK
jgi:hypothetical protein